jgi:hypothetical protein
MSTFRVSIHFKMNSSARVIILDIKTAVSFGATGKIQR